MVTKLYFTFVTSYVIEVQQACKRREICLSCARNLSTSEFFGESKAAFFSPK